MRSAHALDPRCHIPPRPAATRRPARRAAGGIGAALREASLAGLATLGISWALAELAVALALR
jgi:hypothetical protein